MHMLANLPESFLEKDSFSSSFFSTLQDKPPLARGFAIENTPNVEKMNVEICKEFAAPSSNEHDVKHHYSTFIEIDGKLFELDGRLPTPVLIGSCTREEFLMKTLSEIEKRIKEDTSGLPSSVIALTPKC
ncbi:putative Ubiquitin carboxyl-terminal hydrolase, family 1 [Monocercomonoides exilis]|uniref:putative Ubiquitin carboxyl-terminal hydrolase, family 1 n=1 Tax=Monocercomonoides exilis TaxID=2049356 RepID=UPI00355A11DC|nr:putative Ubiquitin carboxyl-terminal hydrolase, family 1 [Monocercomonoides exilis]|eukprot:MONOS_9526.1-p1 / transcript=MONOS_9526.1 / gene=MONOS_9526 / organism=Monocercomonoides_exilis_PA203 / gene_product=unspecified product / transcript_product=unspecified product / location=Mono_scaffold00396:36226-36908(-) / protein_length=129 / sequence_SO=supercontig / SO=protein_coding / is_pseudo=false